jgi:hypothetical protein
MILIGRQIHFFFILWKGFIEPHKCRIKIQVSMSHKNCLREWIRSKTKLLLSSTCPIHPTWGGILIETSLFDEIPLNSIHFISRNWPPKTSKLFKNFHKMSKSFPSCSASIFLRKYQLIYSSGNYLRRKGKLGWNFLWHPFSNRFEGNWKNIILKEFFRHFFFTHDWHHLFWNKSKSFFL